MSSQLLVHHGPVRPRAPLSGNRGRWRKQPALQCPVIQFGLVRARPAALARRRYSATVGRPRAQPCTVWRLLSAQAHFSRSTSLIFHIDNLSAGIWPSLRSPPDTSLKPPDLSLIFHLHQLTFSFSPLSL